MSRGRLIAARAMRLGALAGRWHRSLLVGADGGRDTNSIVDWLQGPSLYGDLRQPAPLPRFEGVRCLRDLTTAQTEALAMQEGFAGRLVAHADHFEWTRFVDFQPPQVEGDRGRLADHGDVMIEEGYASPYVEHWHRRDPVGVRSAAVLLRDAASGTCGLIVRVGDAFLYARGRRSTLGQGVSLLERVRDAPDLAAAQDLIDCEISLGVAIEDWRIERSTLPFRVGTSLLPRRVDEALVTDDVAPDGKRVQRCWTELVAEGDPVC